mmetsp:Transcript_64302/g.153521  ORF Transcript_64302/g.153521 Transcript_64302/m.153521 type:complete len:228 (+) Transcript_64302:109-792(+)
MSWSGRVPTSDAMHAMLWMWRGTRHLQNLRVHSTPMTLKNMWRYHGESRLTFSCHGSALGERQDDFDPSWARLLSLYSGSGSECCGEFREFRELAGDAAAAFGDSASMRSRASDASTAAFQEGISDSFASTQAARDRQILRFTAMSARKVAISFFGSKLARSTSSCACPAFAACRTARWKVSNATWTSSESPLAVNCKASAWSLEHSSRVGTPSSERRVALLWRRSR